ncbi:MAG TPA: hypothetical protein VK640_04505 [Actinomycetes bacterium]|nr:hypothetical protein [Actinomycetes bacterium]
MSAVRAASVGYRGTTTTEPGASLALRVMAGDTWTVSRSTTVALPPEQVHARVPSGWIVGSPRGRVRTEVSVTTGSAALRVDVVLESRFRGRRCTTLTIRPAGTGSEITCSVTARQTLLSRAMSAVGSMDALVGPDVERALARISTLAAV